MTAVGTPAYVCAVCSLCKAADRTLRRYMAPEVLSNSRYSEKADVYSFGIMLHEVRSRDH